MNFFLFWTLIIFIWFLYLISIIFIISTIWNLNNLDDYENFKFPIISIYVISFATLASKDTKNFLQKKIIYQKRLLILDIKFILFTFFIILKLSFFKTFNSNFSNYVDIVFFMFLFILYFFSRR